MTSGKWDERYRNLDYSRDPSPLLVQLVGEVAPGRALDLACGAGRNAIYLAQFGWQVTAVDASQVAIDLVRGAAAERGVTIDARVADLENCGFVIAPDTYDLICDFFYLERDLFPRIRAGVRPGGLVAASIHLADDAPDAARPRSPRFVLQPGELRRYFEDWKILYYKENGPDGEHRRKSAHLVVRRA